MNDFNMVNVDSQSQVGKSINTTKLRMLELDERDFNEFLPVLKQLQITSSKILKDLNPGAVKRDKKTLSLPYNLLKKFQTLKSNLSETNKVLQFQGRVYGCSVANRDFEKMHDQQFFRKTLKSYDEKRLWMKQYILSNEATVQKVQEEVKKNVDYQTHQYTEFRRQLNIERLEHNLEPKIDLMDKSIGLIIQNNRLREKIKAKMAILGKKEKKTIQKIQQTKQQKEQESAFQSHDIAKMTKVPCFTPFLLHYFAKQNLFNEMVTRQVTAIKRLNKRITYDNQQLKLAIDKIQQKIEFLNSQVAIALQQLAEGNDSPRVISLLKEHRVTKTDYFIYLKQIQRYCHQILNIYGNYFQYALQNRQFPNHTKSKSATKQYKMPSNKSSA